MAFVYSAGSELSGCSTNVMTRTDLFYFFSHTLLGWAGSVPGGIAVIAAMIQPGAFMPVRALARSRCSTLVPLKGLILRADMLED